MAGFDFLPSEYDAYWRTHCAICRAPITQPSTGRPRVTCSAACRQRLRRSISIDWYDQVRNAKDDHEAEKILHMWERKFGPFDSSDKPDGTPNDRWRLKYRLVRGIPIPHCRYCHRPIIVDGECGPATQYCSSICKRKMAEERHTVEEGFRRYSPEEIDGRVWVRIRLGGRARACKHCGKPFPLYYDHQVYCSKRCRQAAWRARRKRCAECGEWFMPTRGSETRQRFCSKRCANRQRSRNRTLRKQAALAESKTNQSADVTVGCSFCGKRFATPANSPSNFCSDRCRTRFNALKGSQ
ncbi:MAG: hypothetical protein JXJ17_15315 [Anaerolineae bacterium]|nr:hypothetical protein [Anaerolineae bacterium]